MLESDAHRHLYPLIEHPKRRRRPSLFPLGPPPAHARGNRLRLVIGSIVRLVQSFMVIVRPLVNQPPVSAAAQNPAISGNVTFTPGT